MPVIDGMTMLDKLREDEKGKKIKVIVLTNLTANDSTMKNITKNNLSYYAVKADFSIDNVVNKAKETLGIEPFSKQ